MILGGKGVGAVLFFNIALVAHISFPDFVMRYLVGVKNRLPSWRTDVLLCDGEELRQTRRRRSIKITNPLFSIFLS